MAIQREEWWEMKERSTREMALPNTRGVECVAGKLALPLQLANTNYKFLLFTLLILDGIVAYLTRTCTYGQSLT
ncbi:hypothetical protein PROFUN_15119 [Planoprotostelium fungivorum]|uniref:Uncharacterized protein n=1 Tax=Planoprotostelium fungivorum TaxID=1890364 RepID=A0A2P6MZU4_9EUKA|nr:hypothetical protein PROFUN_15119 [Planoprotostelium fungivorum]